MIVPPSLICGEVAAVSRAPATAVPRARIADDREEELR